MMTNAIFQFFTNLSTFQTGVSIVVFLCLFTLIGFWVGARSFIRRVKKIRVELDALRRRVRAVFDIPVTSTIPTDMSPLLKAKVDAEVHMAQQASIRHEGPFLKIRDKLQELGPAEFAYPQRSQESAVQIHDRLIAVFSSVSEDPEQIVRLFYDGEFTQLFRLSGRLNSYFPDTKHATLVSLATAQLEQDLNDRGLIVQAPRPLSIADSDACDLEVEDMSDLGSLPQIRERVMSRQRLIVNSSAENLLVIECLKPGVTEAGQYTRPHLLVASKRW